MIVMARLWKVAVCLVLAGGATVHGAAPVPAESILLPAPSECRTAANETALLPGRLAVYAPAGVAPTVEALLNILNAQGILTGLTMTGDRGSADVICLLDGDRGQKGQAGEGYEARLETRKGGHGVLTLRATAPQGLFYAWQSTAQILNANRTEKGFSVPCFTLRDKPRFEWRGIMLDVSRHFFTMAEVKRMIDTMCLFKLNRLHLHLTDGPGWRLEIKKYPLLTAMSAWRVPLTDGEWNWKDVKLAIQENDPEASYGGFYTQEQMKEIIAYARSRHVTVVPEIELPGHSYAAMHAYGDLICDGVDFAVEGKRGKDTVCMGRAETLQFFKDVIDELKTIFPPGNPIHLGHDEVSTESWKQCKYCQERLKHLNKNELKDLSSDFLQQTADYVRQGGYDAIVWDEGGELEADKHIFIMSWRGNDLAAAAARQGHPVILAPCSHFYFDYYQAAAGAEPKATGGLIPLKQVYGYKLPDLSPEEMKQVRGLQANIWTEYLYDMGLVEYMAWPRALALSERAWSDCDPQDFRSFRSRATLALRLLEKLCVKYRPIRDDED